MAITFAVTKVKELMTPSPIMVNPGATLQLAAKKMEAINCGILPVGTEDKVTGIITDRDIVVRAIAKGKNPAHERVADYMTPQVYYCDEQDTLDEAAEKMHQYKVSRLLVKNKTGKITGILSFGGILRTDAPAHELANIVKHSAGPVSVV